MLIPLAATVTT